MKINKMLVLILFSVLLAVGVASQISPIITSISKTNQLTPNIGLEEKETCTTNFYDEVQNVYGNCVYYHNYTSCLNTSGANTDCSLKQGTRNFPCKTGELTVTKNATECKPLNKFIISINKGSVVEKKEVDFSGWGPCIYNEENGCLIVTCVSHDDGAFKGKFTDCKGGKSCQKFEICDDKIRVFYKNSREDFVAEDTTFYLSQLALKEVEQ